MLECIWTGVRDEFRDDIGLVRVDQIDGVDQISESGTNQCCIWTGVRDEFRDDIGLVRVDQIDGVDQISESGTNQCCILDQ